MNDKAELKPLWLAMEEKIAELATGELSGAGVEEAIHRVAGALDEAGYNVSKNGGNLLDLRKAMATRATVGRPLIQDIKAALGALSLDEVANPYAATIKLTGELGEAWPSLKDAARRPHLLEMVEGTKLDLLVAKAMELPGDRGVRLLIGEKLEPEVIIERTGIPRQAYDEVTAAMDAEAAEAKRVRVLLAEVDGKPDAERVKHLLTRDVTENLILEMGGVDQSVIDGVKTALEEELKEKQRLAEEAAAKKATEAAGPALEDIPSDEMLEHIEAIREILEFSDVEKEIRVMCEQSSIPLALVDIAVSDPDKLDELEAQAEG